ncbi:hypothetical protein HDU98_007563 [Podochytrium sp. JEL0797]|nr:hypothetical protein HDU98_007563 [Podochytrium sp. JEL0797]
MYTEPNIDYALLHSANRAKVFAGMKASGVTSGVALLKGGESEFRHDTDHEHLFRQESYFFYLFGVNEPDLFGMLDFATSKSHLFIPRLGAEYELWCGKIVPPEGYKKKYGIDEVHFVDELDAVFAATKASDVHILSGLNTDSKREIVTLNTTPLLKTPHSTLSTPLFRVMVDSRIIKTPHEQSLMRHINLLASQAHIHVLKSTKPGMMEFQQEALFNGYCGFEGGCRYTPYTCICGSGANGAVLHYGHAGAPNDKRINDGDMCLLDMGAEYHCYASDITCSYPANGKFTKNQRGVYTAVLNALTAVRKTIRAGCEWTDLHLLAEKEIVKQLVEMNVILLNGKSLQEVFDLSIGALFMPHGLGHMLGMDTHDVGGYPTDRTRETRPGLSSLRLHRRLEAGMVLTSEPGCYFIEGVLIPAMEDPVKGAHLNKQLILDEFMSFGGVRLEENLIITEDGCINMSEVPREIEEIEALMA